MLLLALSPALAAAPIPAEVQRCIDSGAMWLADPAELTPLSMPHPDGGVRDALRIVDRFRGYTGYMVLDGDLQGAELAPDGLLIERDGGWFRWSWRTLADLREGDSWSSHCSRRPVPLGATAGRRSS